MKLIRVTQIEKFRRYITEHSSYDTEQSVIDTLTGIFTGNEYTRIGTAFHRIVEGDTASCVKLADGIAGRGFDIDGYIVKLSVPQCKVAVAYKNQFPEAFHEIREYMEIEGVIVTGCADMINGFTIRDIKTKFSPINDADYTDSCQWRYYMELFGVDEFHFDLFEFKGYKKETNGYDVRGLKLAPYNPPITCYYYNGIEQDNRNLVKEFVQWAKFRKLYDNLPEYDIQSF